MPRPSQNPDLPNDVAERLRIEELKLDAAVIHQLKQELAEEYMVPAEDVLFMGMRDTADMEERDIPPNTQQHVMIFLHNAASGRPWVLPLVSDWRYHCMTIKEPCLYFSSHDALTFGGLSYKLERGLFQSYGREPGTLKPLTDREWKNFIRNVTRIGVWNWQGYYLPIDGVVEDGHMWWLEIHDGDRHMRCSGYNGYPDNLGRPCHLDDPQALDFFNRLERAVKRLGK